MRTIKFRGKRLDGKWVYGYVLGHDTLPYMAIVTMNNTDKSVINKTTTSVEPDTIGQFTGLYDKYGKEIYEGDIIQHRRQKVIVEFYRGAYGYGRIVAGEHVFVPFIGSDNNKDALQFPDGTYFDTDFCEVIGNIHDNLKLL